MAHSDSDPRESSRTDVTAFGARTSPAAAAEEGDITDVPIDVVRAARAAFDRRARDAAVADLVYDSVVDGDRRYRDRPDIRQLHFRGHGWAVGVEVHELSDDALDLVVTGPVDQVFEIEVQHDGDPILTRSDESGRAIVEPVSRGLVSLVITTLRPRGITRWQTAWVRL